ncbi:chloride transporter [Lampropedia puyangensis]|uniref:Chloride transporter n=1 Tax=Lampropedia puyangensis TaxID=1330072 RepID=A0A4V4GQL5_9BURK|nr:bifunctional chorismate-binding protein/class IV aminotransferase [Lampropedia puyangensis]THT98725.1 chloride transporter [Lampropedia puyangensis]
MQSSWSELGAREAAPIFAAETGEAFVLLDDCDATVERPASRLYTHWHSSLVCTDADDLQAWQTRVQQALASGLHAVLLADYEWGMQLQGLVPGGCQISHARTPSVSAPVPSLRVELFASMQRMDRTAVKEWLDAQVATLAWPDAGLFDWQSQVNQAEFTQAIDEIHAAIERGDTYQINYTFAFHGRSYGSPLALYRHLRQRQPAQFGALMRLPVAQAGYQPWVLSLSPELFIQVNDGNIVAKPMKGTTAVQATVAQTEQAAQWLHNDPKNRAENVMIVDLLRNDLGAVAQTGSVQVRDLFAVQRNGQVLGMTSTVQARLRPEAGLAEVLRASFPCGSITGAPKRKTMELIACIEGAPTSSMPIDGTQSYGAQCHEAHGVLMTRDAHQRRLYTGAIGWVEASSIHELLVQEPANEAATLNYCLSVPIRTLQLDVALELPARVLPPAAMGHAVQFSVGAGIVWDSQAEQEWQECHLKAGFALHDTTGFELFETMRVSAGASCPAYWERHVARLASSALALGFAHDRPRWQSQLQTYIEEHFDAHATGDWRLRMALRSDGQLAFTHGLLQPLMLSGDGSVAVILAHAACHTPAWLRQFKTSLRSDYDRAMKAAEAVGAFDALFFNRQGYLTEGARSNVLVKLDADPHAPWYTPPLAEGVLPGVMRSVLLDSGEWNIQERSLTKAQVLGAADIVVCNALRGALHARLVV